MQALRLPVDVLMQRIPLVNRWVTESWRPAAVEAGTDANGPAVELVRDDDAGALWRLRGFAIELHPTEGEGYFLNLTSPAPCVFVMWRMIEEEIPPVRPIVVTVSYNEAGRMLDGGERVDNVPMPTMIADWMRPFVAAHYKPEPRRKVRRNDPFAATDVSGGARRR